VNVNKGEVATDSVDKLIVIVKAAKEQSGKMQRKKGKNPVIRKCTA